jgi:hypothetical protein
MLVSQVQTILGPIEPASGGAVHLSMSVTSFDIHIKAGSWAISRQRLPQDPSFSPRRSVARVVAVGDVDAIGVRWCFHVDFDCHAGSFKTVDDGT